MYDFGKHRLLAAKMAVQRFLRGARLGCDDLHRRFAIPALEEDAFGDSSDFVAPLLPTWDLF